MLQLPIRQLAKFHLERHFLDDTEIRAELYHANRGMKHHAVTLRAAQLLQGSFMITGFTQNLSIEQCALIGADDHRAGLELRDRSRLALGQSAHIAHRVFTRQVGFVNPGGTGFEVEMQPPQ